MSNNGKVVEKNKSLSKIEIVVQKTKASKKKQVNLNFKHDPSLISGAKLQIGSLMVEDTAKAKFNKILNNL